MNDLMKFTHTYQLSKTLRFELKPIGSTAENIKKNGIIAEDEQLAESYKSMKKTIDEYHKWFIEQALGDATLTGLDDYAKLYTANAEEKKQDKFEDKIEATRTSLRKQIAGSFTADTVKARFENLAKQELIKKDLEDFAKANDLWFDDKFKKFTTYFTGFNTNRHNMYVGEKKSTAIAYRIIDENLPKFIDNIATFEKVSATAVAEKFDKIDEELGAYIASIGFNNLAEMFTLSGFNKALTQKQIEVYNAIIGGKKEDKTKIQGLNEYINLYNQQQSDKSKKLPKLKMLYKQILSDRESISFLTEAFETKEELLDAINNFYTCQIEQHTTDDGETENVITAIENLLNSLNEYNEAKIYIKNDSALKTISKKMFGNPLLITDALRYHYDTVVDATYQSKLSKAKSDAQIEKLEKAKSKFVSETKYFSIHFLKSALKSYISTLDDTSIVYSDTIFDDYFKQGLNITLENGKQYTYASLAKTRYSAISGLLNGTQAHQLTQQEKDNIKIFMDTLLDLAHLIKPLYVSADAALECDELFYTQFMPLYEQMDMCSNLYDKVRNFATKKPYSTDKFKLNFSCSTFMDGWDVNKENANLATLMRKDDKYYLAVINKENNHVFENMVYTDAIDGYLKMEYKLLPGPNKMLPKVFFSGSRIDEFNPSDEILRIYKNETFKKGEKFSLDDCHKLIDFYKQSIEKHSDWKNFGFKFKPTNEYADISGFYKDVADQGYKITYKNIPQETVDELVKNGEIYLFEIYNKDFSKYSKGTPNMHTLYFKALFDEDNLKDVVYKLNGQSEMFYRKASLNYQNPTHPANMPIDSKNPDNPKKQSTFTYDITKDKRYCSDKYMLHLPITINFKSNGRTFINDEVREYLQNNPDVNVIGIDRGERNLLYISLIDRNGNVIADENGNAIQYSLNDIVSAYTTKQGMHVPFSTPYHDLLDAKEKQREAARETWGTVETIKELKEGYVSQVVHIIAQLMVKYNAIVVMEDLNFGFKRGRFKVEKQVYQKFEKMLIDKLNYLVLKNVDKNAAGGLYNGLQLANKFESFQKLGKQSGFIFYVPAWNTSKIDPATGFVDFLKPHYTNIANAKDFFGKFDDIRYNSSADYFEFAFDYDNFTQKASGTRTNWTVCTHGKLRYTWNNKLNNNKGATEKIDVTEQLKKLFDDNNIAFSAGDNLVKAICAVDNAGFYMRLIKLLSTVLAMRYSCAEDNADFILSPVADANGTFFDSRNAKQGQPKDADANGAYHIAKKGLWALSQIDAAPDVKKVKLAISNKEWLNYVQQ